MVSQGFCCCFFSPGCGFCHLFSVALGICFPVLVSFHQVSWCWGFLGLGLFVLISGRWVNSQLFFGSGSEGSA